MVQIQSEGPCFRSLATSSAGSIKHTPQVFLPTLHITLLAQRESMSSTIFQHVRSAAGALHKCTHLKSTCRSPDTQQHLMYSLRRSKLHKSKQLCLTELIPSFVILCTNTKLNKRHSKCLNARVKHSTRAAQTAVAPHQQAHASLTHPRHGSKWREAGLC